MSAYNHVFALLLDDGSVMMLRTADDNQSLYTSVVRTPW
jgi:hypothetical protein